MALVVIGPARDAVKADCEAKLKFHRAMVKQARAHGSSAIDHAAPTDWSHLHKANRRADVAQRDRIAKENFHLAQKLFNIMEKPSAMAVKGPTFQHPHTLNYRARAEEAQKINLLNQKIASKLDAVKPNYQVLGLLPSVRGAVGGDVSVVSGQQVDVSHVSAATDSSVERLRAKIVAHLSRGRGGSKLQPSLPHRHHPTAAAALEHQVIISSPSQSPSKSKPKPRKPKIILEYNKEQGEYVIDVVVMKEPFRDRFAIFGIDVFTGQRFELFVASEEVMNILEGEMVRCAWNRHVSQCSISSHPGTSYPPALSCSWSRRWRRKRCGGRCSTASSCSQ